MLKIVKENEQLKDKIDARKAKFGSMHKKIAESQLKLDKLQHDARMMRRDMSSYDCELD